MAILQVYLDESGKQSDHPLIAVCCTCGPQMKTDKFSDDWKALLRRYGVSEFHMKRACEYSRSWGNIPKQTLEERMEALKPFADCICDNLEAGWIQAWDVKGFRAIPPDARKKIGNAQDPYYLAFVRGLLEVVDYVQGDDVLSIICDYDEETALTCHGHYLGVRRARPDVRAKVASISFADDKHFLPLQASDFMAYLTRHQARAQFYRIKNIWLPLFNYMIQDRGPGKILWKQMFSDEQKTKNSLRKK